MASLRRSQHLNFLPEELRPQVEFSRKLIPASVAGVVALYIFVTIGTVTWTKTRIARDLAQSQTENATLAKEITVLTAQNEAAKRDGEQLTSLQKLLGKKGYWSELFNELSALVPEGIWLTSLSNPKASATKGMVIKGEAASQELVANFFRMLETSEHFGGASIVISERDPNIRPIRYRFEFFVPIDTAAGGT